MRMQRSVWLAGVASALLLVACTHQERKGNGKPSPTPNPNEVAVEVTVASVLLADDCQAAAPAQAPPAPPVPPSVVAEAPARRAAPSTSAMPADVAQPTACQQSTLQLSLVGGPTGSPSRVDIVKVRMLDINGKFIQELSSRNPQAWSNADSKYQPWAGAVSPSETLNVIYDLSAPDWAKIGNGDRWSSMGMGFKLELTVRVSGAERTVEFVRPTPEINRDPPIPT